MSENNKCPVSTDLTQNIEKMEFYFHDCADIKKKQMKLGRNQDTACYLTFIEVSVDMGTSALGETLKYLNGLTRDEILCTLQENALGISDATYFSTIEEAVSGLLTGEAILFVDGFDRAVKIPDDGYPNMGITEVDSEKVIRGSNEGFCDSVKQNAALIRKRIRSPRVKVRGLKAGIRSNTNVYLVYVEDLANPGLVKEIEKRLQDFTIDGILDSGMLEQLAEKKWYSPFPQFQTTQRPDRAAMAVLEGRVIVMCDNSPIGLILPGKTGRDPDRTVIRHKNGLEGQVPRPVKRRPGVQPHDEQRRGQCVGQRIVLRDDAHGLQAAGSGVAGLRV